MNKLIRLPLSWRREDTTNFLFIRIGSETNKEWCLNLCLLREGLIDSLTKKDRVQAASVARLLTGPQKRGGAVAEPRCRCVSLPYGTRLLGYLLPEVLSRRRRRGQPPRRGSLSAQPQYGQVFRHSAADSQRAATHLGRGSPKTPWAVLMESLPSACSCNRTSMRRHCLSRADVAAAVAEHHNFCPSRAMLPSALL